MWTLSRTIKNYTVIVPHSPTSSNTPPKIFRVSNSHIIGVKVWCIFLILNKSHEKTETSSLKKKVHPCSQSLIYHFPLCHRALLSFTNKNTSVTASLHLMAWLIPPLHMFMPYNEYVVLFCSQVIVVVVYGLLFYAAQ